MVKIYLKKGKEKSFLLKHPWIFSGAIEASSLSKVQIADGETVSVYSSLKQFIGYGLYNSNSQIRVRLYSFLESQILNDDFFTNRMESIIKKRKSILSPIVYNNACRLIFSEADQFSGLTVDKFSEYLSLQITSLALWFKKDIIIETLVKLINPKGIYLRTEKGIGEEEGLHITDGLIWGEASKEPIIIEENAIKFIVNISTGQKTGFYNDQRENRLISGQYAKGKRCLDICTYTGGFALNLASQGAQSVIAVDVSQSALLLAQQNAELNQLKNIEFHKEDGFKYLEQQIIEGKEYDLIVLDPPKFTHSKSTASQALKGYIQLNTMAMKCLSENGILITCSCSGRISREDFQFAILQASLSAKKNVQILERRGSAIDHPYSPYCPETDYLKCFICCVSS